MVTRAKIESDANKFESREVAEEVRGFWYTRAQIREKREPDSGLGVLCARRRLELKTALY
jgi:hypothetical protein